MVEMYEGITSDVKKKSLQILENKTLLDALKQAIFLKFNMHVV